jgi:drug/metabolite transporter (DMT)-like permease
VDGQGAAAMAGLCAVWAMQQIALKAVAGDVAPTLQMGLRYTVAAVLVVLLMAVRGQRLTPGFWRPGLVVGVLFGLEFLLVGEGVKRTSAGHLAVFLYTAPIWAALGLHLKLPNERLSRLQWSGIALAFVGIAFAFLEHRAPSATAGGPTLAGDALGLLAGAAWGMTTVAVRTTRLSGAAATETLVYQLVIGTLVTGGAAVLSGQTSIHPTPLALASLAFQAFVVSFASYLAWFSLLRRYLASQLGVFSFLTPLFAVGFGAWLLGEPLEHSFLVGAVLVLAGITLVSGGPWLVRALTAPRPGA